MSKKRKYIEEIIDSTKLSSLFLVNFYNGLSCYAIGTNVKEAIESLGLGQDIMSNKRIEDFSHLVRFDGLKEEYLDSYRRKTCKTNSFTCFFDDYADKYWLCINNNSGQKIRLKCGNE